MATADSLNADQLKTLLGLAIARVKDISDALEKTWLIQIVCAAAGVALVYDIAELPRVMCKLYGGSETCSLGSAAAVLVAVEFYYFMRFGQQVSAFVEARALLDDLLGQFVPGIQAPRYLAPLKDSMSFFEGYYSRDAFASWAPVRVGYFLLFVVVSSAGQSAALVLLLRGFRQTPMAWAVAGVAVCALVILYGGFWASKRQHPYTTRLVLSCVSLVVAGSALFWLTGARA